MEWSRFPVKAMAKLGWIPDGPDLVGRAEEIIRDLIDRAGGPDVTGAALYRKNDPVRANAKMDPYALKAWCWQVLAKANEDLPNVDYKRGTVTLSFLKKVAQLSWSEDGPRLAKEFLGAHGIPLVLAPHLPKTYLDGAALRLGDGGRRGRGLGCARSRPRPSPVSRIARESQIVHCATPWSA